MASTFFLFVVFNFVSNVAFRLVCSAGVSIVCFFSTIVPRDIPNKYVTLHLYGPNLTIGLAPCPVILAEQNMYLIGISLIEQEVHPPPHFH